MTARAITATAVLVIAAASTVIEVIGGPVTDALAFRREAILQGEWWRLVTANVVHLNGRHMLLNVAALLLLGWLLWSRPLNSLRFGAVCLATAAGVGLLLLLATPSVDYYVGLSGWLHGLAVMVVTAYWRSDRLVSASLAFALVGKIGWEAVYGPNPATEAAMGGAIVTASHRYGALSAALSLLLAWGLKRLHSPRR